MPAQDTKPAEKESSLSILIFDDGSVFDYLDGLSNENVVFETCRSFSDLADCLGNSEKKNYDIICIDLFCDEYATFELLGVSESVSADSCGLQILESILPKYISNIDTIPVLIFSSFPEMVRDLRTEKVARSRSGLLSVCNREKFSESFKKIIVESEVRSQYFVETYLPRDINQSEYAKLFEVLSDEFLLTDVEQREFLEIVGNDGLVSDIFKYTRMPNRRVDELLSISISLDQFISSSMKRTYLENQDFGWNELSFFNALLKHPNESINRILAKLEQKLGGRAF